MNKSNVMEIKKILKITENNMPSIDKICTCFVNGEKKKLISNTEKFFNLDEEEQFKYIELFKNVLTGAIGKKLINLEYTSDEASKAAQDNIQSAQVQMFDDDQIRDEFFDKIIDNYEFGENYLIVVGRGVYDVPVKASDGAVLEDETLTYDFMITAICPVHSTKAGLTLDTETGRMISSKQVQIVEAPVNGFLYPAFNDRQTDLHAMLYFTKKPQEDHPELMEALMGNKAPTSSVAQQQIFENIVAAVTDDKADFEVIKTLHENLSDMVDRAGMDTQDKKLTKDDIKDILKEAGVDDEKLTDFDHVYEKAGGNADTDFTPQNLMTIDKFNIKAPDVEIKIKPDRTGLVQKKRVDGRNCIVITLEGDIELNGIQVSETS